MQPAIAAIKKAGLTLVANETLDLNAPTFRTEAEKIVQAHPDAIMTEALGSADPTLFAEIKQLNGGKMIPIIGTSAAISPAFFTAAARAVGAQRLRGQLPRRQSGHRHQRARLPGIHPGAAAVKGKVANAQTGDFTTYFTAPGAVHLYDGMNLAALAMVAANSTDTAKWSRSSPRSATACPGRGRQLLRPGRRGAQGRQEDPLRRSRRADELRLLP